MKRKSFLVCTLLLLASKLFSQDISANEKQLHTQLNAVKTEKEFIALIEKYHPQGEITFNIGIYKKGKVETIFKSSTTITQIKFINEWMNLIKDKRFELSLRKKEKLTTTYTFTF